MARDAFRARVTVFHANLTGPDALLGIKRAVTYAFFAPNDALFAISRATYF